MLDAITHALQNSSSGAVAPAFAFALGLLSAIASSCCTLPAMGVLVAYSGTRQAPTRRASLVAAAWFLVGSVLALVILGLVAGLVGHTAQRFLGRYWKLFAGVMAVLVGAATLRLLPSPKRKPKSTGRRSIVSRGSMGAALGGLALGGGVAACSLPCNPGIFIVLGADVLMGKLVWGMVLMTAFAVGFSVPLAAILLGVSFGKASISAGKAEVFVRTIAGVLLIGAGLYLLGTFK